VVFKLTVQCIARMLALACLGTVCMTPALGNVPTPAQQAAQQLEWCKRIALRLPVIKAATCVDSALRPSGATSRNGFPLLVRQIAPVDGVKDKTIRILLLGGIHGDELTAPAIVFQWLQFMSNAPANNFYWTVVPVVNPDGLFAPRSRRVNANGVDLNRNFPTPGWEREAPKYWAQHTRSDPRRFPGRAALSEPESRWVNAEMERFRPHVIISVHAPFGVLDFDGPVTPPQHFGRLVFNRVGVYPGSLGNYSGMHKNVPVITIELPNARSMPSDVEVKRIWQDMLLWIENNVPNEMASEAGRVHSHQHPAATLATSPTR
jgi:hypothetical protein